MGGQSRRRHRHAHRALRTLVAGCAAAGLFATGCSEPEGDARADYVYRFSSLAEMVATSDLVLVGRVEDEIKTPVIEGDGTEDASYQGRFIVVAVQRVLYATKPSFRKANSVTVGEGFWEGGRAVVSNGLEWSHVGDRGFFFLAAEPCRGRLVEINHQGRYLIDGDRLYGSSSDDELVTELMRLSPEELADAIGDAAADVRAGEVEPQPAPSRRC